MQGAHDAVDRIAEAAAPRVQRLQQTYDAAGNALHSSADGVRETSDQWAESLRCTVRDHPLSAVAAAVAVGLIFARLTS